MNGSFVRGAVPRPLRIHEGAGCPPRQPTSGSMRGMEPPAGRPLVGSRPDCVPPAVSSPRTRRGCSSPRRPRPPTSRPWWSGGPRASRSSTSWDGRSSAACGSWWIPASSSRDGARSSSSPTRSPSPGLEPSSSTCVVAPVRSAPRSPRTSASIELHAVDIDPIAVACARRNVAAVGGEVHEGDLYDALPASLHGRVDVLVANAPYVPTDAIALLPAEARVHEPRVALDGGPDGLDVQRRVIDGGPAVAGAAGPSADRDERATSAADRRCGRADRSAPRVERSDALNATVVIGTAPAG